MQFPNDIQAALLFNDRVSGLEEMVRDFVRVEEARSGTRFNVPEAKPGVFYRLYGGDQMTITFEYVDGPANMEVFQQPLASTVTGLLCPDIRERLTLSRSHILVNVSHGVLGNSPEIMQMLQQIDYPIEGQSLPQFLRRLDTCALASRIVGDHSPASLVHWTQSNQLIAGEHFDGYAAGPAPGPLNVHPFLFGDGERGAENPKIGIRTFGMRHFIGREVLVQPSVLPWAANYDTILAFLRVATIKNGYVIPHGDTFGPEDRSLSYRVLHRDAEADDVPLYELVPLMHREFDFQAEDYVPTERRIDDRSPPAALMPEDDEAKFELVNQWREKPEAGGRDRRPVRGAGAGSGRRSTVRRSAVRRCALRRPRSGQAGLWTQGRLIREIPLDQPRRLRLPRTRLP